MTVPLSRCRIRHSSSPLPGDAFQRVVASQKSSSQAEEPNLKVQVLLHLSAPENMKMGEETGDFSPGRKSRSWLTTSFPGAQN